MANNQKYGEGRGKEGPDDSDFPAHDGNTATKNLFTPLKVGRYTLKNRILMAPMTRNRAQIDLTPTPLAATYYSQRASAGLIVTEATQFSDDGQGYPLTPGIYADKHVAQWKKIVDAVHEKNCVFFCQLWHCGRYSHSSFQPDGRVPGAPSPVPINHGTVLTMEGPKPWETPRALTVEEIERIKSDFRKGVENALEAGFDGVEIHGANGYLVDQFLRNRTNLRTDAYGGAIENRAKLLLELVEIAVDVAGADRVGVRLSPGGSYLECLDSDHLGTFTRVVQLLEPFNLAYLHLKESDDQDLRHGGEVLPAQVFRPLFSGPILASTGYTSKKGDDLIAAGDIDAVCFGRLFLANPDLPRRFKLGGLNFNPPDFGTFFGGTEKGYTDYPSLPETAYD